MTRSSYKVDTPRLRVFQFENRVRQLEPLLDTARDPVTSFRYDGFTSELIIEVVDNDGRFVKDLISNEIKLFARKNLDRHGHMLAPEEFDTQTRVSFEMLMGEEESGEIYGTVFKVMTLNGSEDGSVVRIFIRGGEQKHNLDPNIGATTISTGVDFQSSYVIGTYTKLDDRHNGEVDISINIDATMSAIEQLLAIPIVSIEGGTAAVVALDPAHGYAIRNKLLQKTGSDTEVFLSEVLGFSTIRNPQGQVKLADTRKPSKEQIDKLAKTVKDMPTGVLHSLVRLNDISSKLGSAINYGCKRISHANWLAVLGFPQEVTTMYLIGSVGILNGFTQGSKNLGGNSPNAKRLTELSRDIFEEVDKFRKYSRESLFTKIGNNRMFVFRAGTERSNVISIVDSAEVAAADLTLIEGGISLVKKDPFTTAPTRPSEVAFNWESVMEQYKNEMISGFREIDEVLEYLGEQGQVIYEGERAEVVDMINKSIEATEARFGLERDPGALAAYLQFLSARRAQGGDKITVRTPLQLAYYGEEALNRVAYLQHVKSPVLDNPERHTVEATTTGLYHIFGMRHVVTDGGGYSEFDLSKIGYSVEDSNPQPVMGEELGNDIKELASNEHKYRRTPGLLPHQELPPLHPRGSDGKGQVPQLPYLGGPGSPTGYRVEGASVPVDTVWEPINSSPTIIDNEPALTIFTMINGSRNNL